MKLVNAACVTVAVMGSFVCLARGNHSAAFKDAQTKGADARVRLCVHDERGTPIADASIRATLANRESDYSMHGVTDTNGIYVVSGRTTGDYLQLLVTKAGYYDSWKGMSYIEMGKEHEVVDGKWQPFDTVHNIVLRRVQNPAAPEIGRGNFALTKHLNCWLGFDIQKHDFVHPHGGGEVADFEVMIQWNGKWYPDYAGMGINLRFTMPYSGYYEMPVNPVSKFKGPYAADVEKTFCQTATFDEQVVSPTKRIRHPFNDNKCWVVRSRCKVDETGKLVSANYSVVHKINFCGKPDGRGGLRITGAYNPIPNDTNLEPK